MTDDLCTRRGGQLVLWTPSRLLLVERACIELLAPYLGEDQETVGARVTLKHTAPTLKGMHVTVQATVREVDRRRVTFDVTVLDEVEQVGEGEHDRFVIDRRRHLERLEAKAQAQASARRSAS